MRENTELRLQLKEMEMIDRVQQVVNASKQPQDNGYEDPNSPDLDGGLGKQNRKLKAELKVAYSELAELKQTLAMKDRRIAHLQSKNAIL